MQTISEAVGREMQTILVHFDVEESYVLLETFVVSAKAAERVVAAINKNYFNSKIQLELVILPPEPGTLRQYVGLVWKPVGITFGALVIIIGLMDSQTVQDISRELTGSTPSEMIVEGIEYIREMAENDETSQILIGPIEANIIERVIAQSARFALERPRDEIARLAIPEDMKYEIETAQADLYGAALANPDVRAIGFSEDEEFPIQRNQFAVRAVRPSPPKMKEDELPDWRVEIVSIRVTSPNFDRLDQSARKWKGRFVNAGIVLFEIDDEEFWQRLGLHESEFSDTTELLVQLATRLEAGRAREHRAIRILKIDGVEIAKPLSDDAIKSKIGAYSIEQRRAKEPDLFDD